MVVMESVSGKNAIGKRRAHRKSRQGCRNCKIRRVKCDETRPQCQRCGAYGILCNYDPNAPDLQMSIQGPQNWKLQDSRELGIHKGMGAPAPPFCSAIISADATTSFELDGQCVDRLNRFRAWTVFTLGSSIVVNLYENELLKLAYSNPFLMHAILAVTATHDRYLNTPAAGRRTVPETYHRSQCAALFNRKLSQPIQPQDRDPLWATAAFLGIIALSSVEASTPEEAWPLKTSEPSDLEWLRMSEGKMAVWNLTDPIRPGGMFRAMSDEYAQLFSPIPSAGIDGVPSALSRLCNLDASSTAENNPYFAAVHTLARLQNLPSDQITMSRSHTFVHHMQRPFKTLLQEKDPVALLLLALWYTKARRAVWWTEHRATVECQSICLYLQRYHQSNSAIQESLPWESSCAL